MTAIGELAALLAASGMTPEKIALAIDLAQRHAVESAPRPQNSADISADISADRRRARDRERKRLSRVSAEIPQNSAEIPQTSKTPLTLKEKKVRVRKSPSAPIPPDWQPSQSHFDAAERLGIPRTAVLAKAEDMRLWAKSTGALKVDWDATFHGFLRRDAAKLATAGSSQFKWNGIEGVV